MSISTDIPISHDVINSSIIVICAVAFIIFSFTQKVRQSNTWKATVTPLASIIGSGFLVVTPLYVIIFGKYALLATILVVFVAYLMGYVMRFNIRYVEPRVLEPKAKLSIKILERISFPLLGVAYLISVPFYIKLLSLFVLRGINTRSEIIANSIATAILGFIGITGKLRGFKRLELLEEYAVNIKLAIIFSMIIGLIIYNFHLIQAHVWQLTIETPAFDIASVRKLLGTIIIIQGFETSRFLSLEYSPTMRINTMRYAQILSAAIYVVFVGLSLVVFDTIKVLNETSIIDVSQKVALVLPGILIAAAVLSQFSAAVADTVSAGGLFAEATLHRFKPSDNYLVIAIVAIILTWATNIFEIITLASRAFALYYFVEALGATLVAWEKITDLVSLLRMLLFLAVTIIALAVTLFGIPA